MAFLSGAWWIPVLTFLNAALVAFIAHPDSPLRPWMRAVGAALAAGLGALMAKADPNPQKKTAPDESQGPSVLKKTG